MSTMLGIIEGFYGPVWSWQERRQLVSALAPHGYGFYLYAPKADAFLRRRWQEPHPPEATTELARIRPSLPVRRHEVRCWPEPF